MRASRTTSMGASSLPESVATGRGSRVSHSSPGSGRSRSSLASSGTRVTGVGAGTCIGNTEGRPLGRPSNVVQQSRLGRLLHRGGWGTPRPAGPPQRTPRELSSHSTRMPTIRTGATTTDQADEGTQLPWKPYGTRIGRCTAATSSSVAASRSTRSEAPRSRSYT